MKLKLLSVVIVGFIIFVGCKKDEPKKIFANLRCIEKENSTDDVGYGYYYIGSSFAGSTCDEMCDETSQVCYEVDIMPSTNLVGNGGCHLFKGTPMEMVQYWYYYGSNASMYSLIESQSLSFCNSYGGYWDTQTKR